MRYFISIRFFVLFSVALSCALLGRMLLLGQLLLLALLGAASRCIASAAAVLLFVSAAAFHMGGGWG